jgi:hypothetical protein
MTKDVLITPASGLIDFKDAAGTSDATIQLDDLGNLNIFNTGGDLTIGNTAADVYIGNGVANVDLIFEQDGEIRALTGKLLTLGSASSSVNIASTITSVVSINPGSAVTGLNLNNNNIIAVNNLDFNDAGPNEGISWSGGNSWKIYESPNDLTTNGGGNLQIVQGSTRRATFNTSGQLEIPVGSGAPLVVASTTAVTNLNADLLDGNHASAFAAASHTHSYISAPADFGTQTANTFLAAPNGAAGNPSFRTIVASDIPTLNQNTTGTASNVTGTVAIANGGTGSTTAQAAINALAGATTSGRFLRGNGTNVVMNTIQAADVPTLNQNTTGSAGSVTNSITFNDGGSGATSGTTYNGSAAQTISYNTLGAAAANHSHVSISYAGGLTVNEDGGDSDTRIEGDTDENLLFVDASTDRVGIGTNTPQAKFDVSRTTQANTLTHVGTSLDVGTTVSDGTETLTALRINRGILSQITCNAKTSGNFDYDNYAVYGLVTKNGAHNAANYGNSFGVYGRVNVFESNTAGYKNVDSVTGTFGQVSTTSATNTAIRLMSGVTGNVSTGNTVGTTITNMRAVTADLRPLGASCTITDASMFYGTLGGGTPTANVSNVYGLYIANPLNHWIRGSIKLGSAGAAPTGTTASSVTLDLSETDSAILRLTSTDTTGALDQMIGQIQFYGSDATAPGAGVKSKIASYMTPADGDGSYLTFSTSDGVTNDIERVRILSNGDVSVLNKIIISGDVQVSKTITASGTTGAQTINKTAGSVNFAAAATSLTVTNSLVTTDSVILATVASNDSTLKSVQTVASSGSFTLYANAAATAVTRVNFLIIN